MSDGQFWMQQWLGAFLCYTKTRWRKPLSGCAGDLGMGENRWESGNRGNLLKKRDHLFPTLSGSLKSGGGPYREVIFQCLREKKD